MKNITNNQKQKTFAFYRRMLKDGYYIQKVKYHTGDITYELIKWERPLRFFSRYLAYDVAKLLQKELGFKIREPKRITHPLVYHPKDTIPRRGHIIRCEN